jgi:predicted nucleic acid-binding protein
VILVDSSIWIAQARGLQNAATATLATLASRERLLVGDLVLMEVLQGARDAAHAERIERSLRRFVVTPMLTPEIAVSAARNYRRLRGLGVTIRKTADLIIATFCIERGHRLLHADRDFEPMQRHLGLLVA